MNFYRRCSCSQTVGIKLALTTDANNYVNCTYTQTMCWVWVESESACVCNKLKHANECQNQINFQTSRETKCVINKFASIYKNDCLIESVEIETVEHLKIELRINVGNKQNEKREKKKPNNMLTLNFYIKIKPLVCWSN